MTVADYRQIHTKIWGDEWFLNLNSDAKLLFIYLFSNQRSCLAGIYDIPLKVIAFETGLSEQRITELLQEFTRDAKAFYEDGHVWIPKLLMYNANNLASIKIQAHIRNNISTIPEIPLKRRWIQYYNSIVAPRYGIDTLSIPFLQEQEQEQEHDQEQEQESTTPPPPKAKKATTKRKKPAKPVPEAVKTYRSATNRYPPKSWYDEIESVVGTDPPKLKLWYRICHAYVGQGWNPGNAKSMLEFFQRGEIPGTGDRDNGAYRGRNRQIEEVDAPTGWLDEQDDGHPTVPI